jgi:hypothetical protein
MGVPCGPGFPLIRAQALGKGRYPLQSLTLAYHFVVLNVVKHLIADMHIGDCTVRY